MRRYLLAVLVPALLTLTMAAEGAMSRLTKGSEPGEGLEAEVGTGEVALAAFERLEFEFARLKSDVKVSNTGKTLPRGLLLEAEIEAVTSRKRYCAWHETAHYCLIDADGDKIFEKSTTTFGGRLLPQIAGPYAIEYRAPEDGKGWRKEIVYQGSAGGAVRFTFRSFADDWTRPTESREVTYDLAPSGPTEIVYQGAKLQILSATSNALRYKVLAGFRPPP